jgi:hypothetical protein
MQDHNAGWMSSSINSHGGIPESEEEDEDEGRPTLTQNTPRKKSENIIHISHEELPSSDAANHERRKGHHSRTSSGAESVSYQRDTDGRWVLERRRTDEGGEVEVIDREYLAGARI